MWIMDERDWLCVRGSTGGKFAVYAAADVIEELLRYFVCSVAMGMEMKGRLMEMLWRC